MMKLSLMQAFFRSVDANWQTTLIQPLLDCWPHDPGSARVLRASSNFILRYTHQGQPRILRLTPSDQRTPQMLQAELDFLNYLANQGLPVNRPLPARSGRLVETVATPLGVLHSISLEWLEGKELEFNDLCPDDFNRWGQSLGELHNAAVGFTSASRPDWRTLLQDALAALPAEEEAARRAGQILQARLAELPVTPENYGLIHYDFELDNLLWRDGIPQIIDFDDCAHYWLAADIAYALRDLYADCWSQVEITHPSLQAFVAGYRRVRPLPESELAHLPLFMALLNLLMYAELLQIVGEPPSQGEPEWTSSLRRRLAGKLGVYREELDLLTKRDF